MYAVCKNGTRIRSYDNPVRALIHVARAAENDPDSTYRAVIHKKGWYRKKKPPLI